MLDRAAGGMCRDRARHVGNADAPAGCSRRQRTSQLRDTHRASSSLELRAEAGRHLDGDGDAPPSPVAENALAPQRLHMHAVAALLEGDIVVVLDGVRIVVPPRDRHPNAVAAATHLHRRALGLDNQLARRPGLENAQDPLLRTRRERAKREPNAPDSLDHAAHRPCSAQRPRYLSRLAGWGQLRKQGSVEGDAHARPSRFMPSTKR